jgi:hypothetical protein
VWQIFRVRKFATTPVAFFLKLKFCHKRWPIDMAKAGRLPCKFTGENNGPGAAKGGTRASARPHRLK